MTGRITLACTVFLAASHLAAAQPSLPATPCDAAVASADMHYPAGLPLETGSHAFSYDAGGPFVTGGSGSITVDVAVRFTPGPDAVIRISAVDENCSGETSAGTVFSYTFSALQPGRNRLTYDAASNEMTFNDHTQKAAPLGTPRYLFIDVWDGATPRVYGSHSYVIDLLNPRNPTP